MSSDRDYQLATMPAEYIVCRVGTGNHSVDRSGYRLFQAPDRGWTMVFVCSVCGTEVTKHRDRYGYTRPGGYRYPQGYLMEQGGRLTRTERARLFLRLAGLR